MGRELRGQQPWCVLSTRGKGWRRQEHLTLEAGPGEEDPPLGRVVPTPARDRTLSSCRRSGVDLELSRSIPRDRNANCSIDLLLRLDCLFHFIFLAGNFLIKNPVTEKPQKPTDTPETGGHAGTALCGLLPRPAPPPASAQTRSCSVSHCK